MRLAASGAPVAVKRRTVNRSRKLKITLYKYAVCTILLRNYAKLGRPAVLERLVCLHAAVFLPIRKKMSCFVTVASSRDNAVLNFYKTKSTVKYRIWALLRYHFDMCVCVWR
jgi:hypothetical protein